MLLNLVENVHNPKSDREFHKAVVVDNNDPKRAGRVRALVENRLEVPASEYSKLPWIMPDRDSTAGGTASQTSSRIPPVQSEIKVRFENDDPYMGYYSGSIDSASQQSPDVLDNYPSTVGRSEVDGSLFRVDPTTNVLSYFRPLDNTLAYLDANGRLVINIPADVLLNIGGEFDIKSGGFSLITALATLKATSYTESVDTTINQRAASIFRDAGVIADQTGAATAAAAAAALDRVTPAVAELESMLATMRKSATATVESSAEFNRALVEQGIPAGRNSEPTLGTTTNSTKTVSDYTSGFGLNLGSLLSGSLLTQLLKAVPGVQQAATLVQAAIGNATQLQSLGTQVSTLALAAGIHIPTQVAAVQAAITAADGLLHQVATTTGVSTLDAIRSRSTEITTAVGNMNTQLGLLQGAQDAHDNLPAVQTALTTMTTDSTYGNEAMRQDLLAQVSTITTSSVPELPTLTTQAASVTQIAAVAQSLDRADATVSAASATATADPVDARITGSKISELTRLSAA